MSEITVDIVEPEIIVEVDQYEILIETSGGAGPPGAAGPPGLLYVQPDEPDELSVGVPAEFWLDTDDTAGLVLDIPAVLDDLTDVDTVTVPPATGETLIFDGTVWAPGAVASGGGSTILSGTATPTAGTGNVGDYYLDTDDRILYGPKAEPSSPGPAQYVTPAVGSFNNANTTAGMKFQFDTPGVVTGIRVQVFTVGDPTWEAYLFSAGGTMLASKDFTAAVGWNDVIFDTPVSVVPATIYVAAFWQPTNGYSGGQFVAYPGQVSGNVTGIAGSASYASTRDIFPGTAAAGAAWGVSPIFRVADPIWPVAVSYTHLRAHET